MKNFFMNISHSVVVVLALACIQAAAMGQEAAAQGERHWAVTEFSANFMREKPDYAAELGDQALMGTIVELLDTSAYWVKIKSPDPYTAWVNEMGLVPMNDIELRDYLEAPKYICTASYSHIYEEPSLDSPIVSDFVMGDIVRIMYKQIVHTSGSLQGYTEGRAVLKKKFVGVVLPSGKTGYVPAEDVDIFYKWAKDSYEMLGSPEKCRNNILEAASKFLGVPYMWGGTSIKNVDCSGLSRCVYFMNGILLPRNASQQARTGSDVGIFINGEFSGRDLLPGDLLFFGRAATDSTSERVTHVGIYLGEGKYIHSSQVVRISSLNPAAGDYAGRQPIRARRILGEVDKKGSGVVSMWKSPFYFAQN